MICRRMVISLCIGNFLSNIFLLIEITDLDVFVSQLENDEFRYVFCFATQKQAIVCFYFH